MNEDNVLSVYPISILLDSHSCCPTQQAICVIFSIFPPPPLLIMWVTGLFSGNFSLTTTQTGTPLGVFVLDTDRLAANVENTYVARLPVTAVGKDISLKFTHNDTGAAPIIRECVIEAECLYEED